MAELKKVSMIVMLAAGAFLALMLVADIIVFAVCLPRQSCNSYRDMKGGRGEMTYCILYPEDDDMKFSFYYSSDNTERKDSVAYLVPSPIEMYRGATDISDSFTKADYKNYHYLFPGDSISGKVYCDDDCTVYIYQVSNACRDTWNNTVFNQTLLNSVGLAEKKKKKKKQNKCQSKTESLFKQEAEGGGRINIFAEAKIEGPHYVFVEDGLFSSPTGSVDYRVMSTKINVSKAIAKCDSYNCEFSNLTGQGRTETYVAVNIFEDRMEGQYTMEASSRPDKILNQNISIGFAIATGVVFLVFAVALALFFVPKLLKK